MSIDTFIFVFNRIILNSNNFSIAANYNIEGAHTEVGVEFAAL
jgi:hypothetical protein